jgi:hypothetical protein
MKAKKDKTIDSINRFKKFPLNYALNNEELREKILKYLKVLKKNKFKKNKRKLLTEKRAKYLRHKT